MTTNQENIVSHLVSTVSPTVPIYTAFAKPTHDVPKHKYASQMNVWVMKLKAANTVQPERRRKNKELVLITKMDKLSFFTPTHALSHTTMY
jgi:hypothetical protein